jgi:hypothetical protein
LAAEGEDAVRIYIAGPMRGYPEHNFPAFDKAEKEIAAAGHIPVSPHQAPKQDSPTNYLKYDIALLVSCDAICLLSGWEASIGAKCEVAVALSLSLLFVDECGRIVKAPDSVTITGGYN